MKSQIEIVTTRTKPAVNDVLLFQQTPPLQFSLSFPYLCQYCLIPSSFQKIIYLNTKFYNYFILIFNQSGAHYPFISLVYLPLIICICKHPGLWDYSPVTLGPVLLKDRKHRAFQHFTCNGDVPYSRMRQIQCTIHQSIKFSL